MYVDTIRVAYINNAAIREWAGAELEIEIDWQTGIGDSRLTGYRRADGYRAIGTNGAPVFEGDYDDFDVMWKTRTWVVAEEGQS